MWAPRYEYFRKKESQVDGKGGPMGALEVTDGWIVAGGKRLETRRWGPPDGPVIVLLHEGLGAISLWRDFPAALAARTGFSVLAYSRAGYGASDMADLPRPLDYMTREALEVLPVVLDGMEDVILLGHSDGASIAAIYAGAAAASGLRGLGLIAPHFFTEERGLSAIRTAKTAYERTDLKARLARHHQNPGNAFCGWNDAWLDPGFVAWNIEGYLPSISVPVLGLQGRDDQYGTLAQLDALERGVPGPVWRVEIAACKHAPHLEQPEKTLSAVAGFVDMVFGNDAI